MSLPAREMVSGRRDAFSSARDFRLQGGGIQVRARRAQLAIQLLDQSRERVRQCSLSVHGAIRLHGQADGADEAEAANDEQPE